MFSDALLFMLIDSVVTRFDNATITHHLILLNRQYFLNININKYYIEVVDFLRKININKNKKTRTIIYNDKNNE